MDHLKKARINEITFKIPYKFFHIPESPLHCPFPPENVNRFYALYLKEQNHSNLLEHQHKCWNQIYDSNANHCKLQSQIFVN